MAININGSTGISGVDGSAGTPALQGTDTNTGISFGTDEVNINTGGTSRVTVDSSGRMGVGTSSPSTSLAVRTSGASIAAINTHCLISDSTSFATGVGGSILFEGNYTSGGATAVYAGIAGVKNNATDGDYGGNLVFYSRANGSLPTERMRITNGGDVLIAKTVLTTGDVGVQLEAVGAVAATRNGGLCFIANRLTSDGALVSFRQDNTEEGSITVSGTTVSYNGAHLSRWSQLPGGATREEILRGTVLSNIDEMCNWGEEENEQLNRMKVSDVEGDPNVSGVFQAWDDDDDTYTDDFYCAMTGDFIIRIAEGVPVHKGQLLMSAGDGTAKPQDDDIVRSKTIAKVTSNHVTCTYEDGSYCVPCVLMAC